MKNMFEEINAHRLAVQENIKKAFEVGFTGNEDLEKAHQVGDIHPNGKWVWTEYKPGKFDWRPPKKRSDADNTPKGSDASAKKEEDESGKKKLLERKDALDIEIKKLNNQIIVNGDSVRKVLQDKKKKLESEREDIAKRISKMSSDSQTSSSSSKQAVDISKIPDKEFKRITNMLEKQNPLEKDAPRYLEEEAMSDSELKNFLACAEHFKNDTKNINKLTRYRCSEWAKLAKSELDNRQQSKKAKSTDVTQSDDKVKLTEGGFKKGIVEKDEYTRKNAIDLHDYTGESIEYYTDNGEKKKAQPYISEFYNSAKQDAVGGYEAYFDRADSIGTFRTLKEAISALETWINNMRVKGHAKPEWIHNESRGRYQMNYRLN